MTHIDIPADSECGIDNLPYGIFSTPGSDARVGVRYGDTAIDLFVALNDSDFASPSLNAFMARGRSRWVEVREAVTAMIVSDTTPAEAIVSVSDVTMHLPFEVADYVDFYASEHHASNLGRLFRPDAEPLLPNWKHLPVAYHGRAGTVVVSGTDVKRPNGQRKAPDEASPTFGPSRRLDIEAEMGFVVGVPADGPISPDQFSEHVFGAVIVNDWSARHPSLGVRAAGAEPRQEFRDVHLALGGPLARVGSGAGVDTGAGARAARTPPRIPFLGTRYRSVRHVERPRRIPSAVQFDVLVAGPDAGSRDQQRRDIPNR